MNSSIRRTFGIAFAIVCGLVYAMSIVLGLLPLTDLITQYLLDPTKPHLDAALQWTGIVTWTIIIALVLDWASTRTLKRSSLFIQELIRAFQPTSSITPY